MNTKLVVVLLLAVMGFSSAQLPSNLYLVGNASPIGWHIDHAIQLENNSGGVFRYTGPLFAGSYKFADSQAADWSQNFYVKDPSDATKILKNKDDNQWSVDTLGQYQLTLDLNNMSISIQKISDQPVYTHFWLIGDATAAGWEMDNAINQSFTAKSATEYVWKGNLSVGLLKVFMGAFNDFDGSFYMALTDGQNITNPAAQIVNGGGKDARWAVTEAGEYTLTLNTATNTLTATHGTLASNAVVKSKFSVWPNPAKETLHFTATDLKNGQHAEITDMSGRTVLRASAANGKLNVSGLKAGQYILKTGTHTAVFIIR